MAEAYLGGLEDRHAAGQPLTGIASVASFFLSRIDVAVDPLLEAQMHPGAEHAAEAEALHGQVALASAKVAYQRYQGLFAGERWEKLAKAGAQTQRLLWASTSTKNPAYSDVRYVEGLIGKDTVNTIPVETLDAYRDHGDPEARLTRDVDAAEQTLAGLGDLGIDLERITTGQLVDEGVDKFVRPFEELMATLEKERRAALEGRLDTQRLELGRYADAVEAKAKQLEDQDFAIRLWRKDPTLWKDDPKSGAQIRGALGWLHVAEKMEARLPEIRHLVETVKAEGYTHVVHMGMGGSSLAPLTLARTFGEQAGGLTLHVLDTTDPATVARIEHEVPLERTLFIVASKSGTTTEPLAFQSYFFGELLKVYRDDAAKAGRHFVGITDPGTKLLELGIERHFRHVLTNYPDIGGRYSALSLFGMVPAALAGLDVEALLSRARRMAHACMGMVPATENPGVRLGTALGTLALAGRDKVTFLMPGVLSTLGMWLEQLIAESTGKEGKGILPVALEPVGEPAVYGDDRVFVHFTLAGHDDPDLAAHADALAKAGHPLVRIHLEEKLDVAQEFMRWEIATATAGSILGINAFNQPNVQESKDNTARLLDEVRLTSLVPEPKPSLTEGPLSFYSDTGGESGEALLKALLDGAGPGRYVAIMAYLTEDAATDAALARMRRHLMTATHATTTLGYGPRFLHSTGQLHKGGPNTGHFLQLTVDPPEDLEVYGEAYSFDKLRRAQALGDLGALVKHDRRALRVHLGGDVKAGLKALEAMLEAVLGEHTA